MKAISILLQLTTAYLVYESNEDLQKPLNDYINKEEEVYSWYDTGVSFETALGSTAHRLNLTSLQWLNDTVYEVVGGSSIWTHEVIVIEPRDLRFTNTSVFYLASAHAGCMHSHPINTSRIDKGTIDV